MLLEQVNKIDVLKDRAQMMKQVRSFFEQRQILEVDVPALSQYGSIDEHIDLIQATCCGKKAYLHSSPEYGMKRLLSEGIGDIYQFSHVFRDKEVGSRHNPEFSMIEWYRLNDNFDALIDETIALLSLFRKQESKELFSYREVFEKKLGYLPANLEERDYYFGFEIEPSLGKDTWTVILDFPPEQAALSQTIWKGKEKVAKRFEIFCEGIEVANGYLELRDPVEQTKRLETALEKRKQSKKELYPQDLLFIEALEKGIPPCCGVAVGFDRLMMIKHRASLIEQIIPYSWNYA